VRPRRWQPPPAMQPVPGTSFCEVSLPYQLPMRRDASVFAIGSCFARNVEGFLLRDFDVPSHVPKADVPPAIAAYDPQLTADLTLWHRYNVFSIRNSLAWALEPEETGVHQRFVAVGDDRITDPHAGCRLALPQSRAEAVADWMDGTMRRIRTCRLIIVTLGLSEVWVDQETGIVLNAAPIAELWRASPGRFVFKVAGSAETFAELEAIHGLLRRHCPKGFQVVVTVSPIPLLATFRPEDIVVANTASKSILRAAVEQWVASHDDVHYFPSYEMILNSEQGTVWCDDHRHCRPDVIGKVVDVFRRKFLYTE